jgi:hypothetical protein
MMNDVIPHIGSKKDAAFWPSLCQAIAASSGFKRWTVEHNLDSSDVDSRLENLVLSYLRQSLETLAY